MILNKQVALFMNIAHNCVKQTISALFQDGGYNLTPEQFLVMDTLWTEGVLTQQQLADITMRDKNSIVKLIDGLERRELVKRVSNPLDRRQNLIEVTSYSRTIQDDVTSLALKAIDKLVASIPEEALEAFVSVLAMLTENAGQGIDLIELARKYPTKTALKNV